MNMTELASVFGISRRKFNYVVETGLVPIMANARVGKGVVRELDGPQALAVVIACLLSDDGLQPKLIKLIMQRVAPLNRREGCELDVRALWRSSAKHLIVYGGSAVGVDDQPAWQLESGRCLFSIPPHLTEYRIDIERIKFGVGKAENFNKYLKSSVYDAS